MEAMTSSAVMLRPSWNSTPSRRRKIQVLASGEASQLSARQGTSSPSTLSSVSVLVKAREAVASKPFSISAGSQVSLVEPWPMASFMVPPLLGACAQALATLPSPVPAATPTAVMRVTNSRRSSLPACWSGCPFFICSLLAAAGPRAQLRLRGMDCRHSRSNTHLSASKARRESCRW